jgi:hypothetical protein
MTEKPHTFNEDQVRAFAGRAADRINRIAG